MSAERGPAWADGALFYEIFPERFANGDPGNDPPGVQAWGGVPTRDNFFGGDLRGIIEHLSYIADLAVDALYLTPIFHAESNHKYDTTDYCEVDPAFGTLADFDELVAEAHRRGIRIVLDGVFNHSGAQFGPFKDVVLNGRASAHRDWFFVHDFPIRRDPLPSYETFVEAPYMPKLNVGNPAARAHLLDAVRYWTQRGIDGWRLDVPWLVEPSFWRDFRRTVLETNADAVLIGEYWTVAPDRVPDPFHSVMHYPFRTAILDFVARDRLGAAGFVRAVRRGEYAYPAASRNRLLTLLGSHDTPRLLTECGGDRRRALLGLALMLTSPGTPMLYYGDEIGMSGENDPGCRRTMEWSCVEGDSTLDSIRALARLRRDRAALRGPSLRIVRADGGLLVYHRGSGADRMLVVVNADHRSAEVSVMSGADLLWGGGDARIVGSLLALEPWSAAVLAAPTRGS